jgi:hypothetical protein
MRCQSGNRNIVDHEDRDQRIGRIGDADVRRINIDKDMLVVNITDGIVIKEIRYTKYQASW